ncbi:diguanylate cyclase [Candidatus Sodalis endolongispinus]|uniref:Diguanylate cyclase n=1 Tax=Candidatus Sodalis endolongispinus TaxID=2812662 RepID=A0ABS5YFY9_9GAMM|nr:diguanylate cyclase [Candidatus Sodalis endolongispinus]
MQQYSIAAWPPVYAQLTRPAPDRHWLDENIGGWLFTVFHHQKVYLLNAHRQGIYAAVNGQGFAPQAVLPLLPLAAPLITAASRLPQNAPLAARANSAHLTPALHLVPRGLAAFARVADQPVVIAVSPVSAPAGATGPVFYLLSVVPLDATFIDALSHRHLLNPLRFSATPQNRRETALTLIDPQGQPVSAIRWRPQHPGAEVLRATWPVILPVAVLLLAVIAWMMRAIWQSALRLRQTVIALQASEAQALHVAYHDVLTGLPNRAMLDDGLAQALAYPARQSDCTALLALDLDRFKQVNDSLGAITAATRLLKRWRRGCPRWYAKAVWWHVPVAMNS